MAFQGFGESRGRAPEGVRVPQKGARAAKYAEIGGNACRRERGIYPMRLSALASLFLERGKSFEAIPLRGNGCAMLGAPKKAQRENEDARLFPVILRWPP